MNPTRALHLVIGLYTAGHLILAARLPLAAHEALYALYGRHLDWSYLDHPPLMAWLQGLVEIFSTSDFAMRLLPIGLSVAAQYLLARLTRVVYPDASPWLPVGSVLVLQGTLVFHGSMTLSPDAVLVPLALMVVPAAMRSLDGDAWRRPGCGSPGWWEGCWSRRCSGGTGSTTG
ncbi:MAG: glycosyltransferase family 39 protein [Gammaproteobacteria bacterium]